MESKAETGYCETTEVVTIAPSKFDAVLFDMDGVVTRTADVHAAAWKQAFDDFLAERSSSARPFDIETDYHLYVDGKPRFDGVASFLKSRNIELPWGQHDDPSGFETVCALGNLKNQVFLERLQEHHAQAYDTTVALIQSLKNAGIKVAVITASENGAAVLKAANLDHVFDAKVDGADAIRLKLKGKPAPDVFLQAAKELNVKPERAIVVEDAVAGVEAGRNGKFGMVIGVDRDHNSEMLSRNGADVVVRDLVEVRLTGEPRRLPGMASVDLGVSDKNWVVNYNTFVHELQGRREALCALGNGYFVTRATAAESKANKIHFPGTYVAGIYNRIKTEIAGSSLEHEDLVNMPNWLVLTFKVEDDPWFELEKVEILSYEQDLNLHEGILYRNVRFRDQRGRETSLSERRFVHMRHYHLAGLETKITAHNWSGMLTVHSALDAQVINNSGVYTSLKKDKKHLIPIESSINDDIVYLKVQTIQSHVAVAEAARTNVSCDGKLITAVRSNVIERDYVAQDVQINVSEGNEIVVQKIVSLFTSRDYAISEPELAARHAVADAPNFATLIEDQIEEWRHLWRLFDLALETAEDVPKTQPSLLLHLNSFHGLATVSHNSIDLDVAIPARGWSEGYEGHVFWDDLYVFPFFNMRSPVISEALLKYRYRRLDEARKLAATMGVRGVRFPWQSGSSGREETPLGGWDPKKKVWNPDFSHMQVHVNAAIAFNIWQYYQVTGNLEFMYRYGADMLLEIARFFAHFAQFNPKRDRYEVSGIVGPDEFHVRYPGADEPGINNNAYTNLMAVWTLCRAQELLEALPAVKSDEVRERLKISDDELMLWDEVSRKMFIPLLDNGIISQFEGYEKLKDFPRRKDGFIDLEQLPNLLQQTAGLPVDYQISKQPDVLMLFYLFSTEELQELFKRLNYNFQPEFIPKNIEFYVRQTTSGSSLSRVVLSWVLSRMDRQGAWKHLHGVSRTCKPSAEASEVGIFPDTLDLLEEAIATDFFDIQGGTTAQGLHMGAMVGTVDIVQRCYAGIVIKDDILWLNPCLPRELTRLSFHLHYRFQIVQFAITQDTITVSTGSSRAHSIKIGFKHRTYELAPGESRTFNIAAERVRDIGRKM